MAYVREGIQVLGLKEIDQILAQLPQKLNNKMIYSALTRTANIFVKQAKSNAEGKVKKVLGTLKLKRTTYPAIWAGFIFKKSLREDVYWAHWQEFGTSGLKTQEGYKSPNPNLFYSIWSKRASIGQKFRKPIKPNPYIRPAWDSTWQQVDKEFINQMKRTIEAVYRKYERNYGLR